MRTKTARLKLERKTHVAIFYPGKHCTYGTKNKF